VTLSPRATRCFGRSCAVALALVTAAACDPTPSSPRAPAQPQPASTPSAAPHRAPTGEVRIPQATFHDDAPPSLDWVVLAQHPLDAPFHPTLLVVHSSLPDQQLALRAPEDVWLYAQTDDPRESLTKLTADWQVQPDGSFALQASYGPIENSAATVQVDLTLFPEDSGALRLELGLLNTSDTPFERLEPVFCLTPGLHAEAGSTLATAQGGVSWVRTSDRWRKPDTEWGMAPILVQGQPGIPVTQPGYLPKAADQGLIVRSNAQQGWAASLGWDYAHSLSTPGLRCIHAHPDFAGMEPKQRRVRQGYLRLEPSQPDALLDAHRAVTTP